MIPFLRCLSPLESAGRLVGQRRRLRPTTIVTLSRSPSESFNLGEFSLLPGPTLRSSPYLPYRTIAVNNTTTDFIYTSWSGSPQIVIGQQRLTAGAGHVSSRI